MKNFWYGCKVTTVWMLSRSHKKQTRETISERKHLEEDHISCACLSPTELIECFTLCSEQQVQSNRWCAKMMLQTKWLTRTSGFLISNKGHYSTGALDWEQVCQELHQKQHYPRLQHGTRAVESSLWEGEGEVWKAVVPTDSKHVRWENKVHSQRV